MKIAVDTKLFARYSLERTIMTAAQLSYDGVELWGGRPHAYVYDADKDFISMILSFKEQYHMDIPVYMPELKDYPYNIASQSEKERIETQDYLLRSVDLAKKLSIPRVGISIGHAGYFTRRSDNLKYVVDLLLPVMKTAEDHGVMLQIMPLSPMESNIVCTLDDLKELVELLNSDYVCGMLDLTTPMLNWEFFTDYFDCVNWNWDYLRISDSNNIDERHLPFGNGTMYLPSLISMLRRHSYDQWLTVVLDGPYHRDPEIFAGKQIRLLRKLLREKN